MVDPSRPTHSWSSWPRPRPSRHERIYAVLRGGGIAFLLLGIWAGWLAWQDARIGDRLAAVGEPAEAVVEDVIYGKRGTRYYDVQFSFGGAEVSTRVRPAGDLVDGDTTTVIIDPGQPEVARIDGHLDGDAGVLPLSVAIAVVGLLALTASFRVPRGNDR